MPEADNTRPDFQPADPDYRSRVRDSFHRQKVMHTFAITIKDLSPGYIELEMPFREDLTQQHGFLHAGVIATALDSACGYAAFSLMEAQAEVLTVEFKTNLMRPAKGAHFIFRAEVIKPGRTIIVSEGKAYARNGDQEKLIASMSGTLMAITDREDVQG